MTVEVNPQIGIDLVNNVDLAPIERALAAASMQSTGAVRELADAFRMNAAAGREGAALIAGAQVAGVQAQLDQNAALAARAGGEALDFAPLVTLAKLLLVGGGLYMIAR